MEHPLFCKYGSIHTYYTVVYLDTEVEILFFLFFGAVRVPFGKVALTPYRSSPLSRLSIRLYIVFFCFILSFISSPLDMVKTRLQNQTAGGLQRYTGPIDCFKKIVQNEGYGGLYRGLKPNLIGVTPEKAIKLTLNDVFRENFTEGNGDGKIRLWQEMVSGAGAGFFQVAATNPMEIVKLRMQLQGESGAKLTAVDTIKGLGLRGLYKGTAACWLRDVPFSIVFFPLFANLKIAFNGDNNLFGLFCAGALSGSIAAGTVTPCDVIKTRLQVVNSPYTSIGNAFTRIVKEEGWIALKKGLEPRMIVQAPLFGITLLAFEAQKKYLANRAMEAAAKNKQ